MYFLNNQIKLLRAGNIKHANNDLEIDRNVAHTAHFNSAHGTWNWSLIFIVSLTCVSLAYKQI